METPKDSYQLSVELPEDIIHSVIPVKAEIQNRLNPALGGLDSGSPPAFAGVARNDDFRLLSRALQ
jgi:hypothetical protein